MDLSKLSLPIVVLGPILLTAAGAGGSYMVTKEKVAEVSAKQAEDHAQVEKLNEERVDHAREIGEVKQSLTDIKEGMSEIKEMMRHRR